MDMRIFVSFTATPIKAKYNHNELKITFEGESEIFILPCLPQYRFLPHISPNSHLVSSYCDGYKDYHLIPYRINGICY